jgi:hypothetical protein
MWGFEKSKKFTIYVLVKCYLTPCNREDYDNSVVFEEARHFMSVFDGTSNTSSEKNAFGWYAPP